MYTNFLKGTNCRTGSVMHICPIFFDSTSRDWDATVMHEMGRFYNCMGEDFTKTWNDVVFWDNILRALCTNYDYITKRYAKDWGASDTGNIISPR